jgi:hypothetical protein
MANESSVAALGKLVKQLQTQRQEHLDTIAEIDAAFESLGMEAAGAGPRNGRRKAARKTKRKGRGRFKQTAEEFVTGLLSKNKTMTTGQINKRWSQVGRGGKADNTLSKMTREKKIKRKNIKGVMGSNYQLAA